MQGWPRQTAPFMAKRRGGDIGGQLQYLVALVCRDCVAAALNNELGELQRVDMVAAAVKGGSQCFRQHARAQGSGAQRSMLCADKGASGQPKEVAHLFSMVAVR